MNAIIQFDLFEDRPSEIELLRADIAAIGESANKVRKKLFCENNALKKQVYDLSVRLEIIERNLCQKK